MARNLGTIALAGVAVLAVGVGGWLMLSDGPEEGTETTSEERKRGKATRARPAEWDDANRDLEARVDELEKDVARMRGELARLRMVRGSAAARGATVDGETASGEAPAFEGAVRDIIEDERAEAREKRTDAMRDRFSERRKEVLDELVAVAGLKPDQRESIEALWETESEQLIPLFMSAREGERPFAEVREEAEKLRKSTDTTVEEMLTAPQFEKYEELRPGPPGRRGPGGERRGPPSR